MCVQKVPHVVLYTMKPGPREYSCLFVVLQMSNKAGSSSDFNEHINVQNGDTHVHVTSNILLSLVKAWVWEMFHTHNR